MRNCIDTGANDNTEIKRLNNNKSNPDLENELAAKHCAVDSDATLPESDEADDDPLAQNTSEEISEANAEGEPGPEVQIRDLKDQLLRALAEAENTRRRAQREKEDATKYSIANFARDVLSVSDNLARALDTVPEETRASGEAMEALYQGVELTQRELQTAMERHGIAQIEPLGKKFDHNLHQAMFEVESTDTEPGTVVQVAQPGYVIGERLLRPAMVAVAKKPSNLETSNNEAGDEIVINNGKQIDTKA